MTDEPYILDYLHAKRGGKPVKGFGAKRDRIYLETETLPDNFIELWMANVAKHAKPDFSIISYENWKKPARNVECHGKVLEGQEYDCLALTKSTSGFFIKV